MAMEIKSLGWKIGESAGGASPGKRLLWEDCLAAKKEIFQQEFKNFGRLDPMSKAAAIAVAATFSHR